MEQDELYAWLRLQLTDGIGNIGARRLLAAFGLPQQIFLAPKSALESVVSVRHAQARQAEPAQLRTLLDTTWRWLQANPDQHRVLTLGDALYPKSLLNMEDPPTVLYAIGAPGLWEIDGLADHMGRSLAIVGSRNPTPQGAANAHQFAQVLAQSGLCIVSGMALGIDGAAHEGALAAASKLQPVATVAVVGTGLDRVYPRQHHDLARGIARQGIIVSEYPLGTPPIATNFPKRNRIISGLSKGCLVVEAALKSGSLITAGMAIEQGKDVFAIPGSIHSTQARGCHALIRQGAKLVESAQDILEELGTALAPWSAASASGAVDVPPPAPDALLEAMGFDPIGLDALQARTGLVTAALQARLMEFELMGRLARLPGGLFQRIAAV